LSTFIRAEYITSLWHWVCEGRECLVVYCKIVISNADDNARRDSVRLGYHSHATPNAVLKSNAVKNKGRHHFPSSFIIFRETGVHHYHRRKPSPPLTITRPSPPDHLRHRRRTITHSHPHPSLRHISTPLTTTTSTDLRDHVLIRCSQHPRTQLQAHKRPISHRAGYVWVSPRGNTR
jgi:hypothetical protein